MSITKDHFYESILPFKLDTIGKGPDFSHFMKGKKNKKKQGGGESPDFRYANNQTSEETNVSQ
jgi:hypothetical protein